MKTQRFAWNKLTVGVCYYPEHWDEALWESDLSRMLANGITVVRVAEFAWSLFEKTEGVFTFEIDGVGKIVKKGDSVLLPCGVPHAVICHEAGIVVDIFTPMREDFV